MDLKARGTLFIVLTVLSSVAVAGGVFLVNSRADKDSVVSSGAVPMEEVEEKFRVVEYTVSEGDTWETISGKLDIGWELAQILLEASGDAHSLASIHIGNEFRVSYEEKSGELASLEYDISDEELLRIEGGIAQIEEILYDTQIITKRGIIESSLFETAQQEGIPVNIIMELAGIFAWDVDFASSVQPQDSFRVVYEERYRDGEYVGPGKIITAKFINSGREVFAFYYVDPEGVARYYNEEGKELRRQFLRSPLDYKRISSGFSYNRFHPVLNTFTTHRAIDYAAAQGTPVSATADGQVTYAGWNGGNGNYVGIRHANGYITGYAHLSAFAKGVTWGTWVKQNQVVGFVGSTGFSTGPHLHYEMRKNGALINPLRLDLPPGKMMASEYLEEFLFERDKLLGIL